MPEVELVIDLTAEDAGNGQQEAVIAAEEVVRRAAKVAGGEELQGLRGVPRDGNGNGQWQADVLDSVDLTGKVPPHDEPECKPDMVSEMGGYAAAGNSSSNGDWKPPSSPRPPDQSFTVDGSVAVPSMTSDPLLERVQGSIGGVDANGVEASGVEANGVEASGVEASGVEASGVETSGVEASGMEASDVEARPPRDGMEGPSSFMADHRGSTSWAEISSPEMAQELEGGGSGPPGSGPDLNQSLDPDPDPEAGPLEASANMTVLETEEWMRRQKVGHCG